jgi:hypothetical protein
MTHISVDAATLIAGSSRSGTSAISTTSSESNIILLAVHAIIERNICNRSTFLSTLNFDETDNKVLNAIQYNRALFVESNMPYLF